MPSWRASDGRGNPPVYPRNRRPNGNGGFRVPGILKFVVFTGVLAGIVLIVLLTALRPVLRAGVVGWAWDNPSSITRFQFVADFVREDLVEQLTDRAGTDHTETAVKVESGDTIFTIAPSERGSP